MTRRLAFVAGCILGLLAGMLLAPRVTATPASTPVAPHVHALPHQKYGVTAEPTRPAVAPTPDALYRKPIPSVRKSELSGLATWYPARTTVAAAGPALRAALGPTWRGQEVSVCVTGGNCISVALRDFCACRDRNGLPTLIDLPAVDFARLAPLSRGVVAITIEGGVK